MAGKRGRSGRKRGSGLSAVEHALRGSYRPGVHGPLPPGIIPLPRQPVLGLRSARATLTLPEPPPVRIPPAASSLTPDECPDVLNDEGKALWRQFVAQRPTPKMLAPVMLMYIEAYLSWQRATKEVHTKGDYGKLGTKPIPNPFLKLRRDAESTMLICLRTLGWQTTEPVAPVPVQAPKSRLDLFLAARG